MKNSKRLLSIFLAFIFIVTIIPATSLQAKAASHVFELNPARSVDNLEMLPAGAAERSSGVGIFNAGVPKYFWLTNFGASSTDYIEWTVMSPTANEYTGWLHIKTNSSSTYNIQVTQGSNFTNSAFTTTGNGWEKAEINSIQIPVGESKLKLTRTSGSGTAEIKGLDIIKKTDLAGYLSRVAAFKSDTTDFSKSGYGLFFQYGVWGYPEFGDKKSAEDATNDFDAESFANMVDATGAGYIIWSLTWWQYRMQMPLTSVDNILGHSDFTTERNLVGEIAAACKDRGIDFYLYYHQGIQQEPTWKAKQNWPDNFTLTGTGDRETFFSNWESVISEIGNDLGTNLDGWYFDDGCTYWPAPFERLGAAAKAGNPNRLLSYNDWEGTSVTDFQENTFGEGGWGAASTSSPTDPNGILTAGKDKGLLYAGMPMLERENWGIEHANQTISLRYSSSDAIAKIKSAMLRRVPVSLNLQMWEDGRIGEDTLNMLLDVKKGIRDNVISEEFINDDNASITYSSNWTHDTRYSENHSGDIHVNTDPTSNPTVTYRFIGDGIDIVSNQGDWGQKFKVSLKGSEDTDFSEIGQGTLFATTQKNKIVVFSKKNLALDTYTIKIEFSKDDNVTRPENHAQLDGFTIYQSTQTPSPTVAVSKVRVASPLGTNIVANNATVQISASVFPQHATNKTVNWQVTNPSGGSTQLATIDENTGALTTLNKTGFVKVTATSNNGINGSIISGSVQLEIVKMPKTVTVKGNSNDLERTGSWTIRTNTCDTTEIGASLSYDFEGEQIEWYGVIADDHGIAEVFIDGEFKQTVDCYSLERKEDALLFKSEKLSDAPHNITIKLQGKNQNASSTYIEVYRFVMTLKEEIEIPPSQTIAEAKDAADTKLSALKVTNNTTQNEIMTVVKSAIDSDSITAHWTVPFNKVLATTNTIGKITGEITLTENSTGFSATREVLSLGSSGERFNTYSSDALVIVDKEIAKLDTILEPEKPKPIEEVKKEIEEAISDYDFTSETTQEELLEFIRKQINDPSCSISIHPDGFKIAPPTSESKGHVSINLVLTKDGKDITINLILPLNEEFVPNPPVNPEPGKTIFQFSNDSSSGSIGSSTADKSPNLPTDFIQSYTVKDFNLALNDALKSMSTGDTRIVIRTSKDAIDSAVFKEAASQEKLKGVDIIFYLDEVVNNAVAKRITIKASDYAGSKKIEFDNSSDAKIKSLFEETFKSKAIVATISNTSTFKAELVLKLPVHLQNTDLAIYYYDASTNKHILLENKYLIDSANYLHFTVDKGGSYAIMAANK